MKLLRGLTASTIVTVICICFVLLAVTNPALAHTDWVPDRGDTRTYVSGSKGKTITNWWIWNTSADLAGLRRDNNETLEMDVVFYNYDGNAWAIFWPCSLCYKDYDWESNQPRAYGDTTFFDNQYERPFTVGSADATQFVHQKWYYYTIFNLQGPGNGPTKTKLQAQRGHRSPSNCYSALCVFAEETVQIVPFNNFNSPGHCFWQYPRNTSKAYCSQW